TPPDVETLTAKTFEPVATPEWRPSAALPASTSVTNVPWPTRSSIALELCPGSLTWTSRLPRSMTPGATPLSRTATPTPWPFRFAAQAAVAPLVRGKSVTSAVYGSAPVALTGESTTTFVTPAARPRLPSLDALISPLTASISGRLVTTRARAAASADSAPVPWTITRTRAASPCFACSTCATWASVGSIVGTAAAGTSTTGSVGWSVGAGVCSGAAAGAGVGTEAGGEAGAGAGAVCRVAVAGWADFVGRFAVRCASGWTVTRCGVGRFFARLVFEWAGAGADPRAG